MLDLSQMKEIAQHLVKATAQYSLDAASSFRFGSTCMSSASSRDYHVLQVSFTGIPVLYYTVLQSSHSLLTSLAAAEPDPYACTRVWLRETTCRQVLKCCV